MTVNSYHLDFPTTIYGGNATYLGGGNWRLTSTMANIASYNGESINEPWISSMDAYEAGATPTTGAQVVYPLATPLTYTLTTEELTTLLGQNNVWCDAGEISVTYSGGSDIIEVTVDSDLPEYIWPKVIIQMNEYDGDVQIVNLTDDPSRLTTFKNVTADAQIIMNGETNYISGQNYAKFRDKNFVRLLRGVNRLSVSGEVKSVTFKYRNRRYL